MAKKITIVENYEAVLAFLKENEAPKEMVAFIVDRKEKQSKKTANRKPNKTQLENEDIKADILEAMESGKTYTATEIQNLIGGNYSFNKINALISQLVKSESLVREVNEKGRAIFSKVD